MYGFPPLAPPQFLTPDRPHRRRRDSDADSYRKDAPSSDPPAMAEDDGLEVYPTVAVWLQALEVSQRGAGQSWIGFLGGLLDGGYTSIKELGDPSYMVEASDLRGMCKGMDVRTSKALLKFLRDDVTEIKQKEKEKIREMKRHRKI